MDDAAVYDALRRDTTVDITTTGARRGLPHRVEIWFLHLDGRTFITGTPGPRDWLANLRADPSLTFHLKESMQVDLAAIATEVRDPATREWVFDHPAAAWYVERAGRASLVANAPMVELTFTDLQPQRETG